MTRGGDILLLCQNSITYSAMLAFCQTRLRTGGQHGLVDGLSMTRSGDGFAFCTLACGTGKGFDALSRAGGGGDNGTLVPCMASGGDIFLRCQHVLAFAAVFKVGQTCFRTGGCLTGDGDDGVTCGGKLCTGGYHCAAGSAHGITFLSYCRAGGGGILLDSRLIAGTALAARVDTGGAVGEIIGGCAYCAPFVGCSEKENVCEAAAVIKRMGADLDQRGRQTNTGY